MATKKTPKTKNQKPAPAKKKLGEVALVMRVPKEVIEYIDQHAGGKPRTAYVREVLGKGDAGLARILS